MLPETTQVSLPNSISFHPTVLAGCTSVTDATDTRGLITLRSVDAIGGIAFSDAT